MYPLYGGQFITGIKFKKPESNFLLLKAHKNANERNGDLERETTNPTLTAT